MAERSENRVFGKRAQRHVVILASGDKIRHMTVRPWMVAVGLCFAGMFTVGYLAATSYLVLRDDLIGATMARADAGGVSPFMSAATSLVGSATAVASRWYAGQRLRM